MRQLDPPSMSGQQTLPVIEHTLAVYKLWYQYIDHLPKKACYVLGDKISSLLIEILESLLVASYQNQKEKLPTLEIAVKKTDLLKFFMRVAWEIQALDNRKYIVLSERILELGRMIGGWRKSL